MMMGPGRGVGMGMGAIWRQRQTLGYLQEGKPDVKRTLRRLWKIVTPYRWQFIGGTILLLCGVALGLIPPLLIRQIIDKAIPTHNMQLVILLAIGMIAFPLLSALLGLLQNYISVLVAQSMIADLREQLYQHIQSLGIDFFTWTRGGEIQSNIISCILCVGIALSMIWRISRGGISPNATPQSRSIVPPMNCQR